MASLPHFALSDIDWDRPDPPPLSALATPSSSSGGGGGEDGPLRHSRLQSVYWRTDQTWCALKQVSLPPEDVPREPPAQRLVRVARMMAAPPNIPLGRVLAAHVDDDRHYAWLLARCPGGSLRELLRARDRAMAPGWESSSRACCGLAEPLGARIGAQVLAALCFLHKTAHVLHGDVSAANVLLITPLGPHQDADGVDVRVCLVDLDDACDLDAVLSHPTGALVYRPPEWCRPADSAERHDEAEEKGRSSETREVMPVWRASAAVDVWSFGVLLAQLLTGTLHPCLPKVSLFSTESESSVWALLDVLGAVPSRASAWLDLSALHVSEAARAVLERCLAWDPAERATVTELQSMPWFRV